ncbi:MAG: Asp-tRNA(Asn)/Glu-tRNA(Gln) amidotransferase GatCAB subunit B, partial [Dehalococcoidia bacterium]|nr:Asp-tRNA(Asn)/Glu-tRNA(Gln) amidotransferase GatCAB subunit B [Dehalococcoidia bacterium]
AIDKEVKRQIKLWESGEGVKQATLGWDEDAGKIIIQRYKERPDEYRYFPEPDLPPMVIDASVLDEIRARMPELPDARRARFESDYGLTPDEARTLTDSRERSDAFEEAVRAAGANLARPVALWFIGDVAKHLNERGQEAELSDTKVTPAHIAELVTLVESKAITATTAKDVLGTAFETGEMPKKIVDAQGLGAVSDEGAIDALVTAAIEANPKPVEDYRSGKQSAIGFLVGQVMRGAKGRADANQVAELLRKHLDA